MADIETSTQVQTPLARGIMVCAFLVTVCSGISLTFLASFVPLLILHFNPGMPASAAGYQSGLLMAAYQAAGIYSSRFWGGVSDRYGRRSVLILGLLLDALGTLAFGFSPSLYYAVAARFISGLGNGNAVVVKAMLGEVSDSSNRVLAFSVFNSAWCSGQFVGPVVGGLFYRSVVNPTGSATVEPWPSNLFAPFPAAIGCTILMFFFIFTALFIAVFLPETNMRCKHDVVTSRIENPVQSGEPDGQGTAAEERQSDDTNPNEQWKKTDINSQPVPSSFGIMDCIGDVKILRTMAAFAVGGFCSILFIETFPLLAILPVESGGYGWDSSMIAGFFAIYSFFNAIFPFALPIAARRLEYRLHFLSFSFSFPFWRRTGTNRCSDDRNKTLCNTPPLETSGNAIHHKVTRPAPYRSEEHARALLHRGALIIWGLTLPTFPALSNLVERSQEEKLASSTASAQILSTNMELHNTSNHPHQHCIYSHNLTDIVSNAHCSEATEDDKGERADGQVVSFLRKIKLFYVLLVFVTMVRSCCVVWSFSLVLSRIASLAPPAHLGKVTGISHSTTTAARFLAPLLGTPLFAWSAGGASGLTFFPFNRYFIFLVNASACWLAAWAVLMPKSEVKDGTTALSASDQSR